MRISYLLNGLGYTGGSIVLYNFMDNLSKRGYEVYAITPEQRIKWFPMMSKQLIENIKNEKENKLQRRIVKNLDKFPKLKKMIKKIMHKKEPEDPIEQLQQLTLGLLKNWIDSDITISTYCLTAYANYFLMDKTVPLYHMQHYEELFFEDEIRRKLARLTYFLPLGLIANSFWLKDQVKQRIGRDTYLLNPAISREIFYPYQDVVQKYSGPPEKIRIVSYSSSARFKGWEDGVKTMQIVFLNLGINKVEWVVFGGYKPPELGIPLKYVGKVFNKDLAELYSSAHIVFMPSWYESFPLPPLEAMNCGTAVVTSKLGTEDYAINGENSVVVPPREPKQLAEAIISLAKNPELAKEIAIKGLETAKKFTWEKSVDKLEEILKQAIRDYPFKTAFSDVEQLLQGIIK